MGLFYHFKTILKEVTGSCRIAANGQSMLRLICDFCLKRVMLWVPLKNANAVRHVNLKEYGDLDYRLNRSDIYTIYEIFIEEVYDLHGIGLAEVVVDLGANIGLSSLWIGKKCKAKQIIALEPSPSNALIARKNLLRMGIDTQVLEVAAGDQNGSAIFDYGPEATCGRIVGVDFTQKITTNQFCVEVLSMDSVVALTLFNHIDLLKIDIEGGEHALFSGSTLWLNSVDRIIMEIHPTLADEEAILRVLQQKGFEEIYRSIPRQPGNTWVGVFVSSNKKISIAN